MFRNFGNIFAPLIIPIFFNISLFLMLCHYKMYWFSSQQQIWLGSYFKYNTFCTCSNLPKAFWTVTNSHYFSRANILLKFDYSVFLDVLPKLKMSIEYLVYSLWSLTCIVCYIGLLIRLILFRLIILPENITNRILNEHELEKSNENLL